MEVSLNWLKLEEIQVKVLLIRVYLFLIMGPLHKLIRKLDKLCQQIQLFLLLITYLHFQLVQSAAHQSRYPELVQLLRQVLGLQEELLHTFRHKLFKHSLILTLKETKHLLILETFIHLEVAIEKLITLLMEQMGLILGIRIQIMKNSRNNLMELI